MMKKANEFRPDRLDPLETASVDQLRATQLQRLQWSVQHAYDNVPMYKQRFDERVCTPVISNS